MASQPDQAARTVLARGVAPSPPSSPRWAWRRGWSWLDARVTGLRIWASYVPLWPPRRPRGVAGTARQALTLLPLSRVEARSTGGGLPLASMVRWPVRAVRWCLLLWLHPCDTTLTIAVVVAACGAPLRVVVVGA